jgi:hypothetical protein
MFGCAPAFNEGKDFSSTMRSEIVLDKTNKDEVVKLFGIPKEIRTVSINRIEYEEYHYLFLKENYPSFFEPPVSRGVRPKKPYIKALSIDFKNDRVQNYQLFSTFPEEFLTFDQGLIEKIIINTTKESDLIAIFGPPHGKSMLVAAKTSPETTGIENAVTIWSYRGIILNQDNEEKAKSLTLYLNNKGLVIKKVFE